jgi:hypothetical protein
MHCSQGSLNFFIPQEARKKKVSVIYAHIWISSMMKSRTVFQFSTNWMIGSSNVSGASVVILCAPQIKVLTCLL